MVILALLKPMSIESMMPSNHLILRHPLLLLSTFTFHFHALEKEMATHSSVLAWRIPGMGEPGGLPPMGLHRVGHDWSDLALALESKHKFTSLPHLRTCQQVKVCLTLLNQTCPSCFSTILWNFSIISFKTKRPMSMQKAMAPYSSTPAWKIPWMEEPGRLQSMGLQRIGHDRETSLSFFLFQFR